MNHLKGSFVMREHKAIELYDKFTALRNASEYTTLSREVFLKYGIITFRDLTRHLKKYGEYGGAVDLPCFNGLTLLPFHNDVLNKWLCFDNPRVKEIYERIYQLYSNHYPDKDSFKKSFFNIEEDILLRYWCMPMMDTRLLKAPIAGCWDKMEIQAVFLESMGYEVKRFCFHSGKIIRGHTFVLYYNGRTWNTCLGIPLPVRNADLKKLCKLIFLVFKNVPILDKGETCELIEFAPPQGGMSAQDYIQLIENGTVLIKQKRKGKHRWLN